MKVEIHAFLTSALHGGEWSTSRPEHYTSWERAHGAHLREECVWAPEPFWT